MSDVYLYITLHANEDISDVNHDTGLTEDGYNNLIDELSHYGDDIVIRRSVGGVSE